jgi:hypothetical protein
MGSTMIVHTSLLLSLGKQAECIIGITNQHPKYEN